MKTMKILKSGILLIAITGLIITGCTKDKNNDLTPDSSSLQQLSKDDNTLQDASDEALNDVNLMLSNGHLKSTEFWPCNATIDSTAVDNDTITFYITYNGLSCNGKKMRTGQVEVRKHVGTHWHDAGATVIVSYLNLHITKVSTGKSITLNGTMTYQNVTGGFIWQLGNGLTSIIHKAYGALQATFDDNSTRIWNIARQRTFTGVPGQLVIAVDGFGSEGSFQNLVVWGTNRHNEAFFTQITQSIVYKEVCDWDPCSGVVVYQIPSDSKKATITFGYDDNNQPVPDGTCPTKYRLDWEKGTHSGTIYLFLH